MDSRSRGSNASIGVGFGIGGDQNGFTVELAASQNKAKANGDSVTHQNSHVVGTDKVSVTSGRDTNLKGAQLIGDTIEGTVGRDLNIESRQDAETYHSRETASGMQASVCVPPLCYGTTIHASGSVTQGNTDSTYRSVQEQSGIYAGQGGFDVNVRGNTDLKGGILASTAEAGKNSLTTGTLTTSDIENKAEYSSGTSTIAASYSGGKSVPADKPKEGPPVDAHVQWAGNANLLQGTANSLAATAAGNAQKSIDGSAGGITKSAIASGAVVITDGAGQQAKTGKSAEDAIAALSRDTANANQSIDKIFDAQKVKDQQELDRVRSEVAQQLAPMVYQQVGDVLVGASPATKAAVHALVGGLMSQALGGSFATGAAGGAAASLAMEAFGQSLLDQKDLSEAHRKALVQLAGAIVGGAAGLAAGGSISDAAAGASVGKVATENNYLNHIQKKNRAEALARCIDDECRKEVQAEYAEKWTENRDRVNNCSTQAECLTIAQELRAEQQAQGERMAELQAKGPATWTDAERIEYADLRLGDTSINQMRSAAIGKAARLAGSTSLGSQDVANLVADIGIGAAPGIGATVGGSKSSAAEIGNWQRVNEAMSPQARAYQKQVTGRSGQAYVVNGVKFDGVISDGTLVDAKGPGYANFVGSDGQFQPW